jgi:hypothetical protein
VKWRRVWFMERASDRIHTNPTGSVFRFQVRHYTFSKMSRSYERIV